MNKLTLFILVAIMNAAGTATPDYINTHLPEESLIRQAHNTEKYGTEWFGMNSLRRKNLNEINFRLHRAATLTEEDTTKFPYKGPYTNMQIFQSDKKEIIALVDLILRDKSLNIKKEEINKIVEIYLKLEDKKPQQTSTVTTADAFYHK